MQFGTSVSTCVLHEMAGEQIAHVLSPRSGRQVRESGACAHSRVLSAPQIVRLLSNVKSVA